MAEKKDGTNKEKKEKAKGTLSSGAADKLIKTVVQDHNQERLKNTFQSFLRSLKHYLNIREGVDIPSTVASINKDVEFKGYNIYILVFSIFIASIGLNVNSTAVIIGAMLISPLMGPIVGVGLAVGTIDLKLLRKSLKNLGITVLFSVSASTLYFAISPINEDSHELLARTTPTILDALVAIFGGFAGIMASSRSEKNNAVPGVAIATALMPPLCTAGYGIASGNINYFLGAFYLFLLNSLFITLSTVIVVRFVGFPKVDFIDSKRERQVKRSIYAFTFLVLLPSAYIFLGVIQESIFLQKANTFVKEHIENEHTSVIKSDPKFDKDGGSIKLFLMGDLLSSKEIKDLEHEMAVFGLENTRLVIRQNKDLSGDITDDITGQLRDEVKSGILEEMFKKNEELLTKKEQEIDGLNARLQSLFVDSVPAYVLRKEVSLNYPDIRSTYFATIQQNWDGQPDTIPTLFVKWDKKLKTKDRKKQSDQLCAWLIVRLDLDTMRVLEY